MFSLVRKSFDMSEERRGNPAPPATGETKSARSTSRVKIGLALGSGAARGWAHIGVLRELADHGIVPDVIAGTSIGAVVGGCYAAGKLDQIEAFARSLTKRRVFALMDLSFSGMSLISGERLKASLEHEVKGVLIEDLPIPFAAVATEVGTGHEIWLQRGALDLAIRASYALPGIFEPVRVGERYLFDGALVNPVPVTVCRALGAEYVIGINMAADMMYRSKVVPDQAAAPSAAPADSGLSRAGSARRSRLGCCPATSNAASAARPMSRPRWSTPSTSCRIESCAPASPAILPTRSSTRAATISACSTSTGRTRRSPWDATRRSAPCPRSSRIFRSQRFRAEGRGLTERPSVRRGRGGP